LLALERRDEDDLRAYTALLTSEREEQQAKPMRVSGEALAGYVDVLDGRKEAGIARIRRTLDDTGQADHAPGMRASLERVLLEACVVAGDARTGRAATDRALASAAADRLWEAETRRLRAKFLAALGARPEAVEAELARALAVARGQGAKMLELRAAVSLLRRRQERGDDSGVRRARTRLAAIVEELPAEELPEARDNPDLREAAALLDRR
jgi:hypothetical protein